jgi:hypothetical protein
MTRRIAIQRESLEQSLKYCKEHLGSVRAATSAKVLGLLLENYPGSAKELAKEAGCSRAHLFNLLASIRKGQFEKLVAYDAFPASMLNDVRRRELRIKLGTELRCGRDVVDWYKHCCGKSIPAATAYSWCRALGMPIRSLPKPTTQESKDKTGVKLPVLILKPEAITKLRVRQDKERKVYGIAPGEIDCEYPQNPVKRIEGILRCATTGKSMRQIAKELGVAWTDLKRWMIDYKEGIDKLCEIRRGRRPS